MPQLISIILTMFTLIGMLCSILITIGLFTLIVVIVHDNQWRRQQADAFWEAYKRKAIQEVDRIFQERKPGGDTDPQVPIVG